MTDETFHAIMKEWYWIVIWLALIAVAFCPSFLKSRCPSCKKRAMHSVDISDEERQALERASVAPFTAFYLCEKCGARFKRVRSGAYEDASQADFASVFAAAKQ